MAAAVEAAGVAAAAEAAETSALAPEPSSSPRRNKTQNSGSSSAAVGTSTSVLPPYDLTAMIDDLRMSQVRLALSVVHTPVSKQCEDLASPDDDDVSDPRSATAQRLV